MTLDSQLLDIGWVLICAGLVLFMQAGFLCVETGLTRTKNNINVAVKNVADFGVSVCMHWVIGFGIMLGASYFGLFGTEHFLVSVGGNDPWLSTVFVFQAMFCGTAVTIISGAVAERMSFRGYLLVALVVSGLIYPLFGHWVWGGTLGGQKGWLAGLGYVDFAGASVVHGIGAWTALACLLVIGPRQGRFDPDGTAHEIPPSNLPVAMLGVGILWLGWIGFNAGSTLSLDVSIAKIAVNTMLASAAGIVICLFTQLIRHGYVRAEGIMNGSLAGLVSITASCHAVHGNEAVLIGAGGSLIAMFAAEELVRRRIDDVVGAVSVHGFAGVWGILMVGFFGDLTILDSGLNRWQQIGVQLLGAGVCVSFAFGTSLLAFRFFNHLTPMRVSSDCEAEGLNVVEHRATNEHYALLKAMEDQSESPDLSKRVPEEPFTEVGQIARIYNGVLESLDREVARSEAIVRDVSDGILVVTSDGKIQRCNPGFEKMFRVSSSECVGKNVSPFLRSVDKFEEVDVFETLQISTRRGGIELTGERHDGTTFPLELSTTRSSTTLAGKSVYTCTVHDITERRQYEQGLMDAKIEAESVRDLLHQKVGQLESFNRHAVDRELRMVELKKEINILNAELRRPAPYHLNEAGLESVENN